MSDLNEQSEAYKSLGMHEEPHTWHVLEEEQQYILFKQMDSLIQSLTTELEECKKRDKLNLERAFESLAIIEKLEARNKELTDVIRAGAAYEYCCCTECGDNFENRYKKEVIDKLDALTTKP